MACTFAAFSVWHTFSKAINLRSSAIKKSIYQTEYRGNKMLMMVFFGFVMIIMRMFRQNTTSQYLLQSYCQMRSFFTTFSNKQTTDWKQGHKSDGSGMAFRLGACFFGARLKLQFHEDLYQASCVYEMSGHYRMSGWIIEWASCVWLRACLALW